MTYLCRSVNMLSTDRLVYEDTRGEYAAAGKTNRVQNVETPGAGFQPAADFQSACWGAENSCARSRVRCFGCGAGNLFAAGRLKIGRRLKTVKNLPYIG